ncbi:hypothetical protein [Thalassoroseus pseudoceratinae]|uniref:hypothetical protein n=1 Tax=Thalassoroseus pseudoceratinae TaxID=2713176 RepID=UPI001421014A|nr:hypothetical protein [Thalassoroseus pseudoceratinae]
METLEPDITYTSTDPNEATPYGSGDASPLSSFGEYFEKVAGSGVLRDDTRPLDRKTKTMVISAFARAQAMKIVDDKPEGNEVGHTWLLTCIWSFVTAFLFSVLLLIFGVTAPLFGNIAAGIVGVSTLVSVCSFAAFVIAHME